jgi:multidrug resistance efflux pump
MRLRPLFIRGLSVKSNFVALVVVLILGGGAVVAYGFYNGSFTKGVAPVSFQNNSQPTGFAGTVAPVDSVTLSFPVSGTVANVHASVGSAVTAGQVLASLDTSLLKAELAGAQANVAIAQSKLDAVSNGDSTDAVSSAKAALDTASLALTNTYQSAYQTLLTASSNCDDAVRAKLNSYLMNAEGPYPRPVFTTNATASLSGAMADRPLAGTELILWRGEMDKLNSNSPSAALDAQITKAFAHITIIQKFLREMSDVANNATGFPASDIIDTPLTLQTSVAASISEVNDAQTNLRNAQGNIASQKISVSQAQAAYAAASATTTTAVDTSAEQAQVDAARAAVDQIQTQIRQASISAPMSGTVAVQDARVGEVVAANTPVITLITKDKLEIHSTVSQTLVGKIAVGTPVIISFDAFPGETFKGTVSYIDSLATTVNGAPLYKITVAFSKLDPRMRSGLAAKIQLKSR